MRHGSASEGNIPIAFKLAKRGQRMTWVERIDLPMAEKFLLRVIEGHAREGDSCFLKADTIAKEMGCSVRTVFRTVSSCVGLGYLRFVANRYKGDASEYGILWDGVGQALLNNPETAVVVGPVEAALLRTSAKITDDNVATVPVSTDDKMTTVKPSTVVNLSGVDGRGTHDNLSVTDDILSPTHDILSGTDDTMAGVSTVYPREHARTRSLNLILNQRNKPEKDGRNRDRHMGDASFIAGYSPEFEAFWNAYPRRAKKQPAWSEYQAAVAYLIGLEGMADQQSHAFLLAAAKEYAVSPIGRTGGDFRPYPDSWLKDRRFEDDRSEWQADRSEQMPTKPKAFPLAAKSSRGVM